ncbi:MAG: hypothetical protein LBM75_00255 [Myxococcales bacterium]|jgi:rubrerythrin|nr:hypothetical protein [Myxococcales bacterium]
MYCPECQSEYREGVVRCAPCDCALVETLPEETNEEKHERLRTAVAAGEAIQIAKANYQEAARMIETIQARGVDAMLMGDDKAACAPARGCCAQAFFVAVLPEDVEAAAKALRAAHRELVESHEEASLEALDAMVDLDAEGEKVCPACGTSFEGTPQECPDCGLYLGVG